MARLRESHKDSGAPFCLSQETSTIFLSARFFRLLIFSAVELLSSYCRVTRGGEEAGERSSGKAPPKRQDKRGTCFGGWPPVLKENERKLGKRLQEAGGEK